jgi:hypothetical protein
MANSILAKMAVLISANTAAFDRNLKQSQTHFEKFTSTINNASNAIGIAFGSVAAFNGLKYGVSIIANFEQRMSEVQAITGATGRGFEKLKKNALDLGAATKFTSEEVAELQVAYGRLGFTEKEILQVTESTLNLATATGEDLAKSADIAGSTLRGFGLDATEMGRVIDVMASSFNKSALGLENFSEAMKYVAPVAAANNISLEETTALLGTLADNGIRGSMAGTSLRKIISDLDKGTKPLNEKLKDLAAKGFNSADAMDEVGRTAYASLLTLVKYSEKTDELTKSLGNVNGEAEKMARIMEDNLIGDFTKLTSAVDGLILSASGASGPLREMTQGLTELVNFIRDSGAAKGIGDVFTAQSKLLTLIPSLFNKTVRSNKGAQTTWGATAKSIKDTTTSVNALADAFSKVNAAQSSGSTLSSGRKISGSLLPEGKGMSFLDAFGVDVTSMVAKSVEQLNTLDSSFLKNQQSIEAWASAANIAFQMQQEQMSANVSMAQEMGNSIGNAFGSVVTSQMKGVQALKSVTNTFLDEMQKQALAAILRNAAVSGKNPIIAIALASAGFAAFRAMFNSIGAKSAASNSTTTASDASRSAVSNSNGERIQFDARFILKGDDLVAVVDRTNRQNGRLRG